MKWKLLNDGSSKMASEPELMDSFEGSLELTWHCLILEVCRGRIFKN